MLARADPRYKPERMDSNLEVFLHPVRARRVDPATGGGREGRAVGMSYAGTLSPLRAES